MNKNKSQIRQETTENSHVIRLNGRVDQLITPTLEATLTDLTQAGHNHLLIDFTAVQYINSGGLRCLITAWRQARRDGGDVVLYGLNSRLQELFQMVGFDKVFHIYPTRETALDSWQK